MLKTWLPVEEFQVLYYLIFHNGIVGGSMKFFTEKTPCMKGFCITLFKILEFKIIFRIHRVPRLIASFLHDLKMV